VATGKKVMASAAGTLTLEDLGRIEAYLILLTGMAMLLAAMCADGVSTINNAQQIERGYERIDERLRSSQTRERDSFERQLAAWQERADVRRRADMAQVAASLSYLDGRHGQQLARTNELLGYFLQASDKR
jgi:hypothetical protein